MRDDLARARAESAALLNLNPDKLTPADALKCELASALRLVIDDELARATSGTGADLGKLIVAVEHLVGFLKEARPAESEPAHVDPADDPNYDWTNDPNDSRYKLKEAWRRDVEAARADERERAAEEIAQLKDENAQLRDRIAQLTANPKLLEAPKPVEGEVLPPAPTAAEREANRLRINNDRSAYTQQGLRPAGGEPWRPYTHLYE